MTALLALPNGDLWGGFRSGEISLLRNGNATNHTARDRTAAGGVWTLAQDQDGTIWASTGGGLLRLDWSARSFEPMRVISVARKFEVPSFPVPSSALVLGKVSGIAIRQDGPLKLELLDMGRPQNFN